MADHLFLYGTLRPGLAPGRLAKVVGRLEHIGIGSIPGRLYDLGPYPGAILDPSAATHVVGDVSKLPVGPAALAAFDAYEGYGPASGERSLYRRVATPVTLENGTQIECWVYVYNRNSIGETLIEGGDYLAWRARKGS
jgi:gamma-glutamylcyclotransferase (GGCT)/AIG2-like uncharacterized protein YtfP